ncbi:uncharacterized protein LOC143025010 [Oratosquilla oratoria]|uniref:uncharacterized protein LOC143025010 n=1 Tax=Oratosquilla oratoria TaxID=337810 RepID=UPI003F76B2CC
MSIEEEDASLKDLVTKTLQTSGVLGKIQAQLRASVFLALEEDFKEKDIPLLNVEGKQLLGSFEGSLAAALVYDFLQCLGLDFSLAVFGPESGHKAHWDFPGRDDIKSQLCLGRENGQKSPLLIQLLKESKLAVANSHRENESESRHSFAETSSGSSSLSNDDSQSCSHSAGYSEDITTASNSKTNQQTITPNGTSNSNESASVNSKTRSSSNNNKNNINIKKDNLITEEQSHISDGPANSGSKQVKQESIKSDVNRKSNTGPLESLSLDMTSVKSSAGDGDPLKRNNGLPPVKHTGSKLPPLSLPSDIDKSSCLKEGQELHDDRSTSDKEDIEEEIDEDTYLEDILDSSSSMASDHTRDLSASQASDVAIYQEDLT